MPPVAPRDRPCHIVPRPHAGGLLLEASSRSGEVQIGAIHPSEREEWFVGYRRCRDFDAANGPGQDAALILGNERHVVGVVADGVSQSFFGNIAAQGVARHLLAYLWETRHGRPRADELEKSLQELQSKVDGEVQEHQLSPQLDQMLREALERVRPKGTQAVFAAFQMDKDTRLLRLFQVGDVDAWITSNGETRIARGNREGRWSSAGRSSLHLHDVEFQNVTSVVLASDGIAPEWIHNQWLAGQKGYFSIMAEEQAEKDDVSLLSWRGEGDVSDGSGSQGTTNTTRLAGNSPIPLRSRRGPAILAVLGGGALFGAGMIVGRLNPPAPASAPLELSCERATLPHVDPPIKQSIASGIRTLDASTVDDDSNRDAVLRFSPADAQLDSVRLVVIRNNRRPESQPKWHIRIPMSAGKKMEPVVLEARDSKTGQVARQDVQLESGQFYEVRLRRKAR